MKICNN